jgi:hypothetical protein
MVVIGDLHLLDLHLHLHLLGSSRHDCWHCGCWIHCSANRQRHYYCRKKSDSKPKASWSGHRMNPHSRAERQCSL